jgi:hypothetical protein
MSAPSFTIPKAPLTPAGDYRVPAGYFAVTIDFFPPPRTINRHHRGGNRVEVVIGLDQWLGVTPTIASLHVLAVTSAS